MTHNVGDAGHLSTHNQQRQFVLDEAARFGQTVTLAGPFTGGEPGHIAVHNELVAAVQQIATAGGVTLPPLPDTAALGDGGHTDDHNLLEAAINIIRQADAYNSATGGTVNEYWDAAQGKMFRVHSFTGNGTLDVTKDVGRPFEVLLVAGGGGPGGSQPYGITPGGGGAGGVLLVPAAKLALGANPVSVGAGGGQGGENSQGQQGGSSTLATYTAIGGGGGGSYHSGPGGGGSGGGGAPGGSQGGAGGTAGQGHAGGNGWESGGPQFKTEPGAGGGAGGPATHGGWDIPSQAGPGRTLNFRGTDETFGPGGAAYYGTGGGMPGSSSGGVMVKYEVAPWNNATGGTIQDVTDYNGTGQTWRTHTFTGNDSLQVAIAAQPFHVVVGGGGGGSGQNTQGQHGGAGGDGQGIEDNAHTLSVGAHPVTVGAGGNGGPLDGWGQGNGGSGGHSSFSTITSTGGGGGIAHGDQNHVVGWRDGTPSGPTISSTITGTAATYGGAGGPRPYDHPARPGNAGTAGSVVVAYRIG